MKTHVLAIIVMMLFTTLASCDRSSGSSEQQPLDRVTSVTFSVDPSSFSESQIDSKLGGDSQAISTKTYQEIDSVEADLFLNDTYVEQISFNFDSELGVWSTTVDDIPVDTDLKLEVTAFDARLEPIFFGTIESNIEASQPPIAIALYSTDTKEAQAPGLKRLVVEGEIEVDSIVEIELEFLGPANALLEYSIDIDATDGAFLPSSDTVTANPLGEAQAKVQFFAPPVAGSLDFWVSIEALDRPEFKIPVSVRIQLNIVEKATSAGVQLLIPPVLTSVEIERDHTQVSFLAQTSDDGDVISTHWNAEPAGLDFENPFDNPAVVSNFQDDYAGRISVTLTDNQGLINIYYIDVSPYSLLSIVDIIERARFDESFFNNATFE